MLSVECRFLPFSEYLGHSNALEKSGWLRVGNRMIRRKDVEEAEASRQELGQPGELVWTKPVGGDSCEAQIVSSLH